MMTQNKIQSNDIFDALFNVIKKLELAKIVIAFFLNPRLAIPRDIQTSCSGHIAFAPIRFFVKVCRISF